MIKIIYLLLPILANISIDALELDLTTVKYKLTIGGVDIGIEKRTLHFADGQYIFTAEAKTTGIGSWLADYKITNISKFSINNNQLNSSEYQFTKRLKGKITKNIHLKIASKTLINMINNQTYALTEQAHVDKLNLVIALGYALNKNNRQPSYSFWVIDKNGTTSYEFKNYGSATVTLANKPVNTIKLSSFNIDKNRLIQLWLDPKQSYLPLIIKQKDSRGDYKYQIIQ